MPQPNLVPFAPPWLRCGGCVLAMMPLAIVGARLGAGLADVSTVIAFPFAGSLFKLGLHALVHGRCPPSSWDVVMRLHEAYVRWREK